MTRVVPEDRVFFEDPELMKLKHDYDALLAQIQEMTGEDISPALMPRAPEPHWPAETGALLERFWKINQEASRLRSKRMSQQLTRFLKALKGEEEMTDAVQSWWMNRY